MKKILSIFILTLLSSCALDNMGNYSGNRATTLVGFMTTDGTVLEEGTEESYVTITYMFVIEDQKTMGVCAKPANSSDLFASLQNLSISFEVSMQYVQAKAAAPSQSYPVFSTSGGSLMALKNQICPYDSGSYLVGYLDMEDLTALQYITIYVAQNGKTALGSTMTPFYAEDSLKGE